MAPRRSTPQPSWPSCTRLRTRTTSKANMDDDRYFPELDPRNLLPFTRELEPTHPAVERLPKAYVGTDQQVYGSNAV